MRRTPIETRTAMQLVLIESPYQGDVERNKTYARECLLDSLMRGEAPFASHLLYTQVLDDSQALERRTGIEAGLAWGEKAQATVVYTDLGITPGMRIGIDQARESGRPVIFRSIRPAEKHFQDTDKD